MMMVYQERGMSTTANRVRGGRPLLAAGLALAIASCWPAAARADDGSVTEIRDGRGRVVLVVPRQHATVQLRAERVVFVPIFDRRLSKGLPLVVVSAWFELHNPGPATKLKIGFPELRARWVKEYSTIETDYKDRKIVSTRLPTIKQFHAWAGGERLAVKAHPGEGKYRRWFTFSVPLGAGKSVRIHNVYLVRVGAFKHEDSECNEKERYWLDYVLHTGATWSGPIGRGEILLQDHGRLRTLRAFRRLEPTTKDDLHIPLPVVTVYHLVGMKCAGYDLSYFDRRRTVQERDDLGGKWATTSAALALDGDPSTRWTSGPRGRGAWLQVPTDAGRELRGVELTGGELPAGQARSSSVRLACLRGAKAPGSRKRRWALGTFSLPDDGAPRLLTFKRARRCNALRLEVGALHGGKNAPTGLAELRVIYAPPAASGATADRGKGVDRGKGKGKGKGRGEDRGKDRGKGKGKGKDRGKDRGKGKGKGKDRGKGKGRGGGKLKQ
jgi:hypothetical protein